MLTGERPFKGPDFLAQKERMHFVPLSKALPGLPAKVDEFLARALDPDPHKRLGEALAFAQALRSL